MKLRQNVFSPLRCFIALALLGAGCQFHVPGLTPEDGVDLSGASDDGGVPDLARRDDLAKPPGDIGVIDMVVPPPDLVKPIDIGGTCNTSCGVGVCNPCCTDTCNTTNCTQSCATTCGDCRLACTNANNCTFACAAASACAATAGQGTNNVTLSCGPASRCQLACSGANQCTLACAANAQCLVECGGSKSCTITGCTPTMCPNGVLVCNRACP